LGRSTRVVISPTKSRGSITAPFSRMVPFHWSSLGLNHRTKSPDEDKEAMLEPLYRLQTIHAYARFAKFAKIILWLGHTVAVG